MSTMYKKIFGPCIRVQPTSKDLQVGPLESKAPGTEVAPQESGRRDEYDVAISVYITRTGSDAAGACEVTSRLKVGGSTRTHQRSLRSNSRWDPPELVITNWNIVGNTSYYLVKLWESDTWPNPDDTILYIEGQVVIPAGYQSGYKKITFGANGDLPVSEGGFEGFFEVSTKIKKPGQPGTGPGTGPVLPGPGPGPGKPGGPTPHPK